MAKTNTNPSILREEYAAFLAILKDDPEFPATYDEWHTQSTQARAMRVSQGYTVNDVVVHPDEFSTYCNGCGQPASILMLGGFAVAKEHRSTMGRP